MSPNCDEHIRRMTCSQPTIDRNELDIETQRQLMRRYARLKMVKIQTRTSSDFDDQVNERRSIQRSYSSEGRRHECQLHVINRRSHGMKSMCAGARVLIMSCVFFFH